MYALISQILSTVVKLPRFMITTETLLRQIRAEQEIHGQDLVRILAAVTPPEAVRFVLNVELEGELKEGVTSINMTNSQKATASIQPVDKKGQPAPIDGVPTWASSDETIVTVTPAADGLSAEVRAVGPLGTAKVTATGDADLGEGTKPIFGELDVTITQGEAVGFKMTLSDPVEQ